MRDTEILSWRVDRRNAALVRTVAEARGMTISELVRELVVPQVRATVAKMVSDAPETGMEP